MRGPEFALAGVASRVVRTATKADRSETSYTLGPRKFQVCGCK